MTNVKKSRMELEVSLVWMKSNRRLFESRLNGWMEEVKSYGLSLKRVDKSRNGFWTYISE